MSAVRRVVAFFLSLVFIQSVVSAQGRTANWIFGDGYHVKYTDGVPEVMPFVAGYKAYEGAACISDTNGTLLFYSNTIRVWNANFEPLWNSDTLPALFTPPSSSKTNGSIFLPWPGDSHDRFFAFFQMNDLDGRLYLSKIDRSLDSGLGGVVEESKNQVVWDFPIYEQLLPIRHANGRDWWIITRNASSGNDLFNIGLLQPNGMELNGTNPTGFRGGRAGELISNLTGDKIALSTTDDVCFPNKPIIGLFEFDRCYGLIEFVDTLLTRECNMTCYGLAFSPSSEKLYYSTNNRIALYQINTQEAELSDSLIFRLAGPQFFLYAGGQLQQNPIGEINMVLARPEAATGMEGVVNHLAVIRDADLSGDACRVDTFGLYLNGRNNTTLSLPNFANYDLGPLVGSPCDTLSPQDTTQTGLPHPPLQNISWSINPSISDGIYTITDGPSSLLIVHDLYGREVLRLWHEERTTFDLTAHPAGLYLVHLRAVDGKRSLPQKIIRQ